LIIIFTEAPEAPEAPEASSGNCRAIPLDIDDPRINYEAVL